MTGKDPFETGSGGSFRAFIFSSGVETLDIEAFRDEILGNLGFLRVHADFTLVDAILNASIIMTGVGSVSE
jgi:hypothetical protein